MGGVEEIKCESRREKELMEVVRRDREIMEATRVGFMKKVTELEAKVTELKEVLEETEWERGRLQKRLLEKEEARRMMEDRAESYWRKCEYFMEYARSLSTELRKKEKASFFEGGLSRMKKKRMKTLGLQKIQEMRPVKIVRKVNQKRKNQTIKKQMIPTTMSQEMKLVESKSPSAWPVVGRAL